MSEHMKQGLTPTTEFMLPYLKWKLLDHISNQKEVIMPRSCLIFNVQTLLPQGTFLLPGAFGVIKPQVAQCCVGCNFVSMPKMLPLLQNFWGSHYILGNDLTLDWLFSCQVVASGPFHKGFSTSNLKNWKKIFIVIKTLMVQSGHKWHMPRQLSCRSMCKIVIWSDHYFLSKSKLNIYKISIMSS